MAVKVGSARSSFGNTTRGDQHSGLEVSTQDWYLHSKGWRVFRAKDPAKREKLAVAMQHACDNNKIGYSQPDRLALKRMLEAMKPVTYDPALIKEPSNCDCSSLVRVCCFYAGIKTDNFTTPYEPSKLMATNEFVELKDTKYTTKSDYLMRGDILVTKTQGHTVIVLSDGKKCEPDLYVQETAYKLGDRELKNGMSGEDVRELQTLLIKHNYSCGDWGADGDFGDCTEAAVRAFQQCSGIEATGIANSSTISALVNLYAEEYSSIGTTVVILYGNCYVRMNPNVESEKIGVAYKGTTYLYQGEQSYDGWLKIVYKGASGWVSGKYGYVE